MSEQQQIAALKMDFSELQKQIDIKLKARLEKEQQQGKSTAEMCQQTSGQKRVSFSESAAPEDQDDQSSLFVTTQMKRNGSKRYHNTAWQSHSDRKRANTGGTPEQRSPSVVGTISSFSYTAAPSSPPAAAANQSQRPVSMAPFGKQGSVPVLPSSPAHRGSLAMPPPPPPRNSSIAQSHSVPDLSGPAAVQAVAPSSSDRYHEQQEVQRQWSDPCHDRSVPTDGKYQKLHLYLHGVPPGCGTSLTERERMFALETKFGQIKEILEAVGVQVPW